MTRRRQAGFTLIEAVVAFAVLAIGLASVGTSFALAMRTDAQLEAKRDAREFARSRLEAAGIIEKLAVGQRTGREGSWRWVETVSAIRLPLASAAANVSRTPPPLQGYWVEVVVEGPGGQTARLAGLKVRGGDTP